MMRILGVAAIGLVCCCAQQAVAAPLFHVTDLGALSSGGSSIALGMNSLGDVVGSSRGSNGLDHAFLWTSAAGMIDLGTLPGNDRSVAAGINTKGQVVGYSGTASVQTAFLWSSGGGMHDLGFSDSAARAINDSAQVVGVWNLASGGDAFLWTSAGGRQNLGDPDGELESSATAINAAGDVVGTSRQFSDDPHAFLWMAAGGRQDLGDLPSGIDTSDATGINALGQIVGGGSPDATAADPFPVHAFFWTGTGGMQDLASLFVDGTSSAAGINDLGAVVGGGAPDPLPPGQHGHAFLWSADRGLLDLNSLLDASGTGWQLVAAQAINNAGQIAGWGVTPSGESHAFLLTPVPEPDAVTLAICATALLGIGRLLLPVRGPLFQKRG